jgi:uncharacterized membrane protein
VEALLKQRAVPAKRQSHLAISERAIRVFFMGGWIISGLALFLCTPGDKWGNAPALGH